jgi:hypothetical protein
MRWWIILTWQSIKCDLVGNAFLRAKGIDVYGADRTAALVSSRKEKLKEILLASTTDNTVVYFHNRKILFGGCMVLSSAHRRPDFIENANMVEWPVSVKKVNENFPETRLVIPGHGQPGDVSLLDHTVNVLESSNRQNGK